MAISNVNMLANASSFGAYNQKLTQTTKQKLEELGIQYNSNITEKEAQKLISKYEASASQKSSKEDLFSSNGENKNELFERLKNLAQKLGITTKEGDSFQELVKEVEGVLERKIKSSSNDISELNYLSSLSQELANIQSQSNGSSSYDASNQALMMSLEMLSQYNKNFLNR